MTHIQKYVEKNIHVWKPNVTVTNQSGFFLQTFLVNVTFALKSEYDCYKDDASHCIDFKQYFLISFHYSLTSDESYC